MQRTSKVWTDFSNSNAKYNRAIKIAAIWQRRFLITEHMLHVLLMNVYFWVTCTLLHVYEKKNTIEW